MTVLSHVRALLPGTRRERRWLAAILCGLLLAGIAGGVGWYWNRPSEATPGSSAEIEHQSKNPDGSWKYTNRLINETSLYLLLHAHNPVDWYPWGPEALERAVTRLKERYDAQHGGFGGAPKFPPAAELELLLADSERTRDPKTLKIVTHTLDAMAHGGMYDQIGGGFHRYSTDSRWLIPHFEKMLYNQSDLARVYLQAFQVTQNPDYRRVVDDILRFVSRDMTGPDGGFFSAIDSETDAVEGASYLWTEQEIRETLANDADVFLKVSALAPMPEEHGSVLYLPRPVKEVATELRMTPDQLRQALAPMIERLRRVRRARKQPLVDDKVLTSWNGRMIGTYAYAYEVTGNPAYRETAIRAAQFMLRSLRDESGLLKHTYRNGTAKYDAYQEDYAFLICGLLGLHRATGEPRWLTEAQTLADRALSVYQGEVVIRATLRLKSEGRPERSGILRVLLTYQACNDQSCLMPVETVLTAPILIGQRG